ncbi:ENL/AF9-related superfamily elongation complex transcription factor isoform X1 [Colletes latitarsis]|uniref:ENL/AF9-related superfamily elongation complex transcription factor isoform X1 n=2 Tax=Colletes latitarsis TaxID=2605962 RepID=UPI004035726C
MAIRITLECGHSSMLRMRTTPQGYTHDWELFVRGVENADIHHYVEKVVFQLHETFSKPKRVLKDPPFEIKESGYAGFEIPIHIYLKNKDEGIKKIEILYDLNLQPSGPAITNVIRHTEIINNPSDEFRRKLLKGGGIIVSSSESSAEKSENKTPTMVSKPKLSGSETKKHKTVESKTSNSFAELFGTPLKPTKVSQDTKKPTQPEKSSAPKPVVTTEKSDKVEKISKLKDSPHKESKKEKIDDKKDKKIKDQSKDKNRSKEKSKRPSSPSNKSHSSPSNKRPPSPVSLKRPPSPSTLPPAKRPASPKSKEKELKKVISEKEKDKGKEKDKAKDNSKSAADSSKSEKKKDKKKHKEDRDKERKDKYKEGERSAAKEILKLNEKKSDKPDKSEKSEKEKSQEYKSAKDGRKSPKPSKEVEKPKEEKLLKIEKPEKTEKSDKTKDGKNEKDRQKHKHKKREKKDKRDSSKERDKKEKRDRIKSSTEKQNSVPNVPVANPLSTLLAEMPERDSSDSAPSIDDDSFSEPKLPPPVKKEMENVTVSTPPTEMAKPLSPGMPTDIKKEKADRNKREKPKGSKGEEKETRKRKRRSESKGDDEHAVKREKDRGHSTSPPLEPVSSSQSPVVVDQETVHIAKDKEDRPATEQVVEKSVETEAEQVAPDSTNSTLVDTEMGEPPVFSEDYVSQLKDLQQKIMTLQDNQELQRVVQVIAETGQYEITKKTFDFDLCALDRRTVQRLQQFFAS